MKTHRILIYGFALGLSILRLNSQTTVSLQMQDANFPVQFNDGGDFFNNGGAELGMWANSGNKHTVAWRMFKTSSDNSGSDRALQVGDELKITVAATRAFGQIGFSLNEGSTPGTLNYAPIAGSNHSVGSILNIQENQRIDINPGALCMAKREGNIKELESGRKYTFDELIETLKKSK